jgi:chemotaxis protein CheX
MDEVLELPARLDVAAVTTLHGALMTRRAQDVTLDLHKVTHFGALCLQLLIAAARDAQSRGNTLHLLNASDRIITQMRLLGASPETIMEGQI